MYANMQLILCAGYSFSKQHTSFTYLLIWFSYLKRIASNRKETSTATTITKTVSLKMKTIKRYGMVPNKSVHHWVRRL